LQMLEIPREVIEHHLRINFDARPVQQNLYKQSIERQDFIREEIKKLLDAGFIRKVHHPRWLANVSSPRQVGSFGCASTTLVSISHVQNTLSLSHE
jgi:hypothetical protein